MSNLTANTIPVESPAGVFVESPGKVKFCGDTCPIDPGWRKKFFFTLHYDKLTNGGWRVDSAPYNGPYTERFIAFPDGTEHVITLARQLVSITKIERYNAAGVVQVTYNFWDSPYAMTLDHDAGLITIPGYDPIGLHATADGDYLIVSYYTGAYAYYGYHTHGLRAGEWTLDWSATLHDVRGLSPELCFTFRMAQATFLLDALGELTPWYQIDLGAMSGVNSGKASFVWDDTCFFRFGILVDPAWVDYMSAFTMTFRGQRNW